MSTRCWFWLLAVVVGAGSLGCQRAGPGDPSAPASKDAEQSEEVKQALQLRAEYSSHYCARRWTGASKIAEQARARADRLPPDKKGLYHPTHFSVSSNSISGMPVSLFPLDAHQPNVPPIREVWDTVLANLATDAESVKRFNQLFPAGRVQLVVEPATRADAPELVRPPADGFDLVVRVFGASASPREAVEVVSKVGGKERREFRKTFVGDRAPPMAGPRIAYLEGTIGCGVFGDLPMRGRERDVALLLLEEAFLRHPPGWVLGYGRNFGPTEIFTDPASREQRLADLDKRVEAFLADQKVSPEK